ncbi:MAG: ATP-binding protein [Planctomycetota bacterium]
MGAAESLAPGLRLAGEDRVEGRAERLAEGLRRGAGALTPGDLAPLVSAFNEVTSRLERTHAQLRGEVRRLTGELDDAHERLERGERLAALGEMAAGIAHEIRNPLGSIGLYARMLEEDLGSMPASRGTATKIADAVRRLNAIVGDVLSFARDLRPEPRPMRVGELLDTVIDSAVCESLGSRVERAVGVETLVADETLVHQALVNVLRNAAEATEELGWGARVRVGSKVVGELDSRGRRRPAVSVYVRDNGPGIDDEVIRRMFNPFFTTRNTGTGLGLAIVHRIMDAHGGRVVVSNNAEGSGGMPAEGATIELRFPAGLADEEAA